VSYSNGWFTVTYVYDSRDRLIHASDNLTGQGMGFSYDDADRLTGMSRSNGVSTAYTYDARGLMTRIQAGSIIDILYTLDAAGQVTEADYAAAPLDPTTVTSNSSWSLTYDAASQISTAGYAYDPRGRLTNSPGGALQWDGASRLVGIGAVGLEYNALGDLITRAEGGTTNHYFYNFALRSDPIVAEFDESSGQFTRLYVWSPGGLLLYTVELPALVVRYPHFDRVGSTLALSDSSGAVTDAYAYDPYGRLVARTGTNQQPFLFVGRSGVRFEPAGNLSHMRARYYDPATTRFLSPEPIWPDLGNPQKLNPYQYALQSPLEFIDPEGTDEDSALKPVEKMSETELTIELFNRLVDRAERTPKHERGPPRGKLSDAEKRQIARNVKDQIKALKRRYSDWLKHLREALERVREADARAEANERARREAENRKFNEEMRRKYEAERRARQPGGSAIGPPSSPGAPTPVIPLPEVNPQPPAGGSSAPEGDEHGFLFGAGVSGAVPVSYASPDSPQYYLLPLSPKIQSLLFGGDGALTHATSDATAYPGGGLSGLLPGKFKYVDRETGQPVFDNY